MPEIVWPEYACKACGMTGTWGIARCRNQGGAVQHLFVCACGHRTTHFISKKAIAASGIEPIEIEPTRPRHRCEVCSSEGAELHHWAPFHLFGIQSDRWPTSYLCPPCHKRWHDIVTPEMSTMTGKKEKPGTVAGSSPAVTQARSGR